MISKMAMEDIAALRADGIDVPPREVVRLNVLGLRVERGPDSPDVFAAPRVAFLGDVVLREPPLGADMWMRQAADAFNLDDDAQTWFSLRVLSCAVPWRELPDPTRPCAVRKAVERTLRDLSDFTLRQVENALTWCIDGNLAETGENPPPKPPTEGGADDDAGDMPTRFSPEFGLFWRGVALRLGTAADLKDLTAGALMAACDRAEAMSGLFGDVKEAKGRALGDYLRALDAVRNARQDLSQARNTTDTSMIKAQVNTPATTKSAPPEGASASGDSGGSPLESMRLRPQTASMGVISEGV